MSLRIDVPVEVGEVTKEVLGRVNGNAELFALWEVTNVVAQKRLHMTDHGIKHFQIVIDTGLQLLELLNERQVQLSLEKDYGLGYDFSQAVVLLASALHDIGMSVHRDGHEEYSLWLAHSLLGYLLDFLPYRERVIVRSEILHAIISHRSGGRPLTIEAGIVRVADALDLTRERVGNNIDLEIMDIHDVSADSIDEVSIRRGDHVPIEVEIVMNHTAGLFQVDELLKKKVDGSGIEGYLDLRILVTEQGERKLLKQYLGEK